MKMSLMKDGMLVSGVHSGNIGNLQALVSQLTSMDVIEHYDNNFLSSVCIINLPGLYSATIVLSVP